MRDPGEPAHLKRRGWVVDGVLVGADVLTRTIKPCDSGACGGRCCRFGALMEDAEFRRIDAMMPRLLPSLSPAAHRVIKRHGWFYKNLVREPYADPDKRFRASRVADGYCIFVLTGPGQGCALHRLALEEGGVVSDYKPRECFLFPLKDVIRDEVHLHSWRGYACNVAAPAEPPAYLRLESELTFLLGATGYQRLQQGVRAFQARGGSFEVVEKTEPEPKRRGRPPKKNISENHRRGIVDP